MSAVTPTRLVWALGMAFFAIAAGCEALAAANGWSEPLYRTWYLTGAVWTAGWLGLGTAFLLGRTRFGYGFALCLFLAGLFTFLTPRRFPAQYPDVGPRAAALLHRWPACWRWRRGRRDVLPELALAVDGGAGRRGAPPCCRSASWRRTTLPAPGYAIDPATGAPTAAILPGSLAAADAVHERHRRASR